MRHDLVIVGAGFAGSILARVLARAGKRVALLERGQHPRFALGESSTPLAALVLERLARRFDLPDLHHLAAYGRWLSHLPALRRGKKRGFTFYAHRRGQSFVNGEVNEARLLVAASPADALADAHWLRADVDHHLLREALAAGVEYHDETTIESATIGAGGVVVRGRRRGQPLVIEATVAVDASGPAAVLARAAGIADQTAKMRVRSSLLYAHLDGLDAFDAVAAAAEARFDPGPYADQQAAVHHLLDEGWMYQLRFDHGATSVGLLLDGGRRRFRDARGVRLDALGDPTAAAAALLARYPSLAAQHAGARTAEPWRFVPRVQHRRAVAVRPGLLLMPHTFAFIDPLFSTGIAWSLLAVERLVDVLTGRFGDADRYGTLLAHEADVIEALVAAAYGARHDFGRFTATSALYFAAVSFEEVLQRLCPAAPHAVPDAWRGFLGSDQPARRRLFHRVLARLDHLEAGDAATAAFAAWLGERIAPFDIIGVMDASRRNLHPMDLDVLVTRAALLGLDRSQVLAALPRLRGEA